MNRARLRLTDVAVSDIQEQADWYEQRSDRALPRRWESEVTAALIRIEKNPRLGAKCAFSADELHGIRRMSIAGFPRHLIFYRAEEKEITILRWFTAPATSKACFDAYTADNEVQYFSMTEQLADKKCVPCRGGVPPLKGKELEALHKIVPQWSVINQHHITRAFTFPDFKQALDFVNRVGELAEEQGHHPDILLAWGKAEVTMWTHKIDGLTESDFIMAAKIDRLVG